MKQRLLHVGCGSDNKYSIKFIPDHANWREQRLDIDPQFNADFKCSMIDMADVPCSYYDMVYSMHNLEHLSKEEVPFALSEMYRVLKSGAALVIGVPDLEKIVAFAQEHGWDNVAYMTEFGLKVTPLMMLYGATSGTMSHKTAFDSAILTYELEKAGFIVTKIISDENYGIVAIGVKP